MRFIALAFVSLTLLACGSDDDGGGKGQTGGSGGNKGGSGGKGGTSSGGTNAGGSSGSGVGGSGGTGGGVGGTGGTGGASLACPALPPASGTVVNVKPSDAGSLHSIVQGAAAGTTFMLEDGTYNLASTLQLSKDGVSLRSLSNDASKVIIDGTYTVNELVAISASNVTVGHVTLTHAIDHAIHAYPPGANVDVKNTVIYGVKFEDNGEQFVKVNPIGSTPGYVDDGRIECSEFVMTAAGRPHIEPNPGGCYTGGIDVHAGWKWVVRNNRFEGIYCEGSGLAEHAIHFWKGSRDTLVENNTIINCARAIGFGLGGGVGDRVYPDNPHGGAMLSHYDGIIRNNVAWSDVPYYDTGIELQIANQPRVYHNTVMHGPGATAAFSSIDYRFAETDAIIQNNLTNRISVRDGATGTVDHNLENTALSYFVGGTDFHLTAGATDAIDKGVAVGEAGVDIDGQTHDVGGGPDLGADEH